MNNNLAVGLTHQLFVRYFIRNHKEELGETARQDSRNVRMRIKMRYPRYNSMYVNPKAAIFFL